MIGWKSAMVAKRRGQSLGAWLVHFYNRVVLAACMSDWREIAWHMRSRDWENVREFLVAWQENTVCQVMMHPPPLETSMKKMVEPSLLYGFMDLD